MEKYPNIYNRVYESGNVLYVVRINFQNKRYSISFKDQNDAREWLQENYYEFFKNPKKYIDMKRKMWL